MQSTLPSTSPRQRFRWIYTLKFQIVAIAVGAALAATAVTAHFALATTEAGIERALVQGESDDAESAATLLASKVDMLRDALKASARQAPAELWGDREAMRGHLMANAALGSLFEGVLAARPSGELLARLSRGKLVEELPNIGDRAYFKAALRTDQVVLTWVGCR